MVYIKCVCLLGLGLKIFIKPSLLPSNPVTTTILFSFLFLWPHFFLLGISSPFIYLFIYRLVGGFIFQQVLI